MTVVTILLSLNLIGTAFIACRVVDNSWKLSALWERASHILEVMPGENKGTYKGRK